MIQAKLRTAVVNADYRNVANKVLPPGIERITDAMFVNPVGQYDKPPNYETVRTRAIEKCAHLSVPPIPLGTTCNGGGAIVRAGEGRFPAQGIWAHDLDPAWLGPEYVYKEYRDKDSNPIIDQNGVPTLDVRRRFLLENLGARVEIANRIGMQYKGRSPLLIDGIAHHAAGNVVQWADTCDFLSYVVTQAGAGREVWGNIALTLQAEQWTQSDLELLIQTGSKGTIWEAYFIHRPGDRAPKQDLPNMMRLLENIGTLRRNGVDVCLLRMGDEQDVWRERIALASGALINVTI